VSRNRPNAAPSGGGEAPFAKAEPRLSSLTLREKAVLFLVPAMGIISLVYTMETVGSEIRILREEIIKKGETVAIIASRNAELPVLSENRDQLERSALSLMEIRDVAYVSFRNLRFETLIHEGAAEPEQSAPLGVERDGVNVVDHRDSFSFTAPVFAVLAREDVNLFQGRTPATGLRQHIGWVRIGLSKDVMTRSGREILVRGVILAILFTSAGVILVYAFLVLALRPLQAFLEAVKEIREGEYHELTMSLPGKEAGRLLAEFNRMVHAIRQREERLTASEKRTKDLFDRVEHAIFRLDKDGQIALTNTKYDQLCGGITHFHDLVKSGGEQRLLERAAVGPLRSFETTISGKGGGDMTVSMSVYPEIDAGGAIVGFDGYFVDVTEKKKLEQALTQSQKMESLGLLAGGVAHDFNNILSAIIGFAGIVRMQMREDDPCRADLEEVLAAAGRAAQVTGRLLAFSRKQIIHPMPEDLNRIVERIEKFLPRVIGEDIEFKTALAADELVVMADVGQIEQVLTNLATNARDAMPRGGTLTITTERLDSAPFASGPHALITVSDTGKGMDEATRQRIFEPFFTTKGVGEGTGLGLAIAYGIIRQHDGSISVYSEPGKGTTFKIYLKLVDSKAHPVAPSLLAPPGRGTETILVAEDDPAVRKYLRELLREFGYTVIEAADGEEAVRQFIAHQGRIDLLILDVVMPKRNGKETYEEIRKIGGDRRVLFSSGYTADIISKKGVIEAGVNFISKPAPPNLLLAKIRQLLS
jgi:signal transduction histidine kinase/CheY-like chemotaxis protein